jgi:hypothetical protein
VIKASLAFGRYEAKLRREEWTLRRSVSRREWLTGSLAARGEWGGRGRRRAHGHRCRDASSGLYILSNTGYYGANHDKHLPPHAFAESAEQLAARWIREWEHGIDDTGIKPAFVKIGVDAGPLSTIDAKRAEADSQSLALKIVRPEQP